MKTLKHFITESDSKLYKSILKACDRDKKAADIVYNWYLEEGVDDADDYEVEVDDILSMLEAEDDTLEKYTVMHAIDIDSFEEIAMSAVEENNHKLINLLKKVDHKLMKELQ